MFKLEIQPDWFYETRKELHLHLRVKSGSTFMSSQSIIWLCRSDTISFSIPYSQIADLNLYTVL